MMSYGGLQNEASKGPNSHGIYAGRIDMVLGFRALPPDGPKLWVWDWPAPRDK
jgi:hypothetical protein